MAGQRVGVKDVVASLALQPIGDPRGLGLAGGHAQEGALPLVEDRRPPRLDHLQEGDLLARQPLHIVVGQGHPGQELDLERLPAEPVLEFVAPLLGDDLDREDLAQEVAGGPGLVRDHPRGPVMAGDQPPEFPLEEDRNRHGSGRPHVDHVFDVDRRDAPERGVAQVQRAARVRVERRDDRHRGIAGVGDQADPAVPVERPGLSGDVGGGEPEVEVGGQRVVAVLGDHRAVPVLVEPVDQDPVEPDDPADLGGREPADLDHPGCRVQGRHEGPGHRVKVAERGQVVRGGRLEFQDQEAFGPVEDGVEWSTTAVGRHRTLGQEQRGPLQRRVAHRSPDRAVEVGAQEPPDRTPQDLGDVAPQHSVDVPAGLDHGQARLIQRQEDAVGLDAPGDLDRLPVAVRQLDFNRLGHRVGDHGPTRSFPSRPGATDPVLATGVRSGNRGRAMTLRVSLGAGEHGLTILETPDRGARDPPARLAPAPPGSIVGPDRGRVTAHKWWLFWGTNDRPVKPSSGRIGPGGVFPMGPRRPLDDRGRTPVGWGFARRSRRYGPDMSDPETPPTVGLAGLRVASFEARMAGPMADLIRKHGGVPVEAPALREVPIGANPEALAFADSLIAGRFDLVIFLTGVGTRFLFQEVETKYPRERWLGALQTIKVAIRGPKPLVPLREFGVRVDLQAPEPNTWRDLLAALGRQDPRRRPPRRRPGVRPAQPPS